MGGFTWAAANRPFRRFELDILDHIEPFCEVSLISVDRLNRFGMLRAQIGQSGEGVIWRAMPQVMPRVVKPSLKRGGAFAQRRPPIFSQVFCTVVKVSITGQTPQK